MGEFRMPSLGADMEWGKVVEWQVKPGDKLKKGDIVATVETQKGLFDVEIFEDGIMGEPLVETGLKLPVGTLLAMIYSGSDIGGVESIAKVPPSETIPSEMPRLETPFIPSVLSTKAKAPIERIPCSPAARRLAEESGVKLEDISGTGPGGAIRLCDVEQAAQAHKTLREPAAMAGEAVMAALEITPEERFQLGMRQAIAAAMSRSNREIPHYYLEMEIDMSRPLQWLEGENRKRPIRERILPAALLLKAVAMALRDVPELNGYWIDNRLQVNPELHIGFAVALRRGGLITPAIHHVDRMSLSEVMIAMGDLIERTRNGRLRSSEVSNATVTVTNLGDLGVRTVFGIIYPPQVALVAFGRIMERPWAEGGMLGVRRCVTATLSADHRATDGHRGSQFLEALNRRLQKPERL